MPAFTLDTLLDRTRPRPRPSDPGNGPVAIPHRPRPSLDRDLPIAMLLVTLVKTCDCGRVHRCPNDYVLAKYSTTEMSFRYSRAQASDLLHLPREHQERTLRIPFCEDCFSA